MVVLPMGVFFARVDTPANRRSEVGHRLVVYTVGWPLMGVFVGSLAAMLNTVWLDIAFAVYAVIIGLSIGGLIVSGVAARNWQRES
jgi:hypothetical protein